jgi:DNA-nicking Smr family endonuclease
MARRKKRKASSHAKAPSPKEPLNTLGTLGDAMSSARSAPPGRAKPPAPSKPATPPPPSRPAVVTPEPRKVSEYELMAEAFAASAEADPAAKFLGTGYDPGDVHVVGTDTTEPEEPATFADIDGAMTGDDLLFAELMASNVAPLEDRDKYAAIRDHQWVGIRWHDDVQLESMTAEELREPTLTGEQRDLLRRARRAGSLAVVNIRHYRRKEALGEVDAFVRACIQKDHRFVRVVHGKGKQSAGEAVLKPAVVNWCQGVGSTFVRAWAPETDVSGQFGSLVMELKRR